jgi:hypothetical protein
VIGHNVKGQEKEAVGFLDNLKYDNQMLYADMTRVPAPVKEKICYNGYPSRSVEILPKSKRILAMALLGGTAPHFALPQMVYENQEESIWLRSGTMPAFSDEQKAELYNMIGGAVREGMSADANTEEKEDVKIYELGMKDALEIISNEELPEFYQDENGRVFFSDGEEAIYYMPNTAIKFLTKHPNINRAAAATIRGTRSLGEGVGGLVGGLGRKKGKYRKGRIAGALRSAGGAMKGSPVATGLATAGTGLAAAAAGVGGAVHHRKKHKYQLDERNGILYYDGEAVGAFEPIDDEDGGYEEEGGDEGYAMGDEDALPSGTEGTSNPSMKINPADVGEDSIDGEGVEGPDTSKTNNFVQDIGEEDGQFSDASEQLIYDLSHRLERVEFANAVLQTGKQAQQLERYLLEQKQKGAPVGNVEQTVDYLMTQTPEQQQQFMNMLATQPKVAMGRASNTAPVGSADVRADYELHKAEYASLGVSEKDLEEGKYVRINQATGEKQG